MVTDLCPTCGLIAKPEGEPWHDGKHCPRWFTRPGNTGVTQAAAERDCLLIGLERRDASLTKSALLFRKACDALTDGAALIQEHAGLGLNTHDVLPTTSARIDRQDAINAELRLRLAEKGERTEDGSSFMLLVVRPGRCGGQPTIGVTRLPLTAPLSRLRGGDSIEELARDWPNVPAESWVVLKALSQELMEVPDAEG